MVAELIDLEASELEGHFGATTYKRGASYARGKRVLSLDWDEDEQALSASVVGHGALYETTAYFNDDGDGLVRIVGLHHGRGDVGDAGVTHHHDARPVDHAQEQPQVLRAVDHPGARGGRRDRRPQRVLPRAHGHDHVVPVRDLRVRQRDF